MICMKKYLLCCAMLFASTLFCAQLSFANEEMPESKQNHSSMDNAGLTNEKVDANSTDHKKSTTDMMENSMEKKEEMKKTLKKKKEKDSAHH